MEARTIGDYAAAGAQSSWSSLDGGGAQVGGEAAMAGTEPGRVDGPRVNTLLGRRVALVMMLAPLACCADSTPSLDLAQPPDLGPIACGDEGAYFYQCFFGPGMCCCPGSCTQDDCCDPRCEIGGMPEGQPCHNPGFQCDNSQDYNKSGIYLCSTDKMWHCVGECPPDGGI